MKANWILGAVLFLGACGGGDTSDEGAAIVGNDGLLTETKTVDLTADGTTYAVDVRDDGGVAGDITVRSHRGDLRLGEWLRDVRISHNLAELTSDDNTLIVLTNVNDLAEDATPTELAREAREQARNGANCPEECLHCPEDNVFLCQSMCGARH
jgi:hypothetical protein